MTSETEGEVLLPNEWVQANEGTQDIFLEELEVLLKKYYKTSWNYDWKGQEDSIELKLWFPCDTEEDEGTN